MEPDASHSALAAACEGVQRLISLSHRPLLKVTVRVGEVSVELDWPDAAVPAAPVPAAEVAGPYGAAAPDTSPDPVAHRIRADIIGVFHRSPEPGADPFVQPGDLVLPGQQLAIIEAMKVMTPVAADRGGRVTEILIGDGQPVEFGTELMTITADGPR